MSRRIYLDEGFFGTEVGEITDDGRLFLVRDERPDEVFGYVETDGIYVTAGLKRTKIIEFGEDGEMYLACDSGVYTHGTKVGSVSQSGYVYDSDGGRVGWVTSPGGGEGRMDTSGPSAIGCVISLIAAVALVLAPLFAVANYPALLASSSVSDASKVQLIVISALGAIAALLVGVISTGDGSSRFREVYPSMLLASWATCEVTLCVSTNIIEPNPLGVLDWILLVTFGGACCLGWAAVASLVSYIALKAIKS